MVSQQTYKIAAVSFIALGFSGALRHFRNHDSHPGQVSNITSEVTSNAQVRRNLFVNTEIDFSKLNFQSDAVIDKFYPGILPETQSNLKKLITKFITESPELMPKINQALADGIPVSFFKFYEDPSKSSLIYYSNNITAEEFLKKYEQLRKEGREFFERSGVKPGASLAMVADLTNGLGSFRSLSVKFAEKLAQADVLGPILVRFNRDPSFASSQKLMQELAENLIAEQVPNLPKDLIPAVIDRFTTFNGFRQESGADFFAALNKQLAQKDFLKELEIRKGNLEITKDWDPSLVGDLKELDASLARTLIVSNSKNYNHLEIQELRNLISLTWNWDAAVRNEVFSLPSKLALQVVQQFAAKPPDQIEAQELIKDLSTYKTSLGR